MTNTILESAHLLVNALEAKKAGNILLMDISEVTSFADYFIICSGTSDRMLNALADVVHDTAKTQTDLRVRMEGKSDYGWVVVDCGDIVVHVFSPSQRDYYRLEELWEHGKVILRLQ